MKGGALQFIALFAPGARSVRPRLHRWRGVKVGPRCFVGYDVAIGPCHPERIKLGAEVLISIRTTILCCSEHGDERAEGQGVEIGDGVYIGAGVLIMPGVTIGEGAVLTAGSVVTESVPEMVMVQGNPAKPVARCGMRLTKRGTSMSEFSRALSPIRPSDPHT